MSLLQILERLKSSSLNVRVDGAEKSKNDLAVTIPSRSYRALCQELKDGVFFPDPRLIFLSANPTGDLSIRVDRGFSGEGIVATAAFGEKETVPSIADLWPLARWFERELAKNSGLRFESRAFDDIEIVYSSKVIK